MRKITFVIPCYKSEKTIKSVSDEIIETVKASDRYEIILVNDGSGACTWNAICELCDANENVIGIDMSKNFGQHNALMAGINAATGDLVMCLDDDGQTPANEMYSLIDEMDKGYDVVYADYEDKKHSGFRNFGSKLNGLMLETMLDKPRDLYVSSYFVMRRYIAEEIVRYSNPYSYLMGLVLRSTGNISSVRVTHRVRQNGSSGYSLKKLLSLWMNGFTAFSVKPLRIATYMGFGIACLGLVYMIYAIINKITNPLAPIGWTSTMIALLIIGGMILFVLGMIGEYIGRMYMCINNSPQYVIRETRNINNGKGITEIKSC